MANKQHERVSSFEELGLSKWSITRLKQGRRNTLEDLLNMTPSQLRRLRHVGEKTAREIEDKLREAGLSLKDEAG